MYLFTSKIHMVYEFSKDFHKQVAIHSYSTNFSILDHWYIFTKQIFLPSGGEKIHFFNPLIKKLQTVQKGPATDALTSSFYSLLQVWFFLYLCFIALSLLLRPLETDQAALDLQKPFGQLFVGRKRKHLHIALWLLVWNASLTSI